MTKSYTYNGILSMSYETWDRWIKDSLAICTSLGYEANFYDIGVKNKADRKVRSITGLKRKMKNIVTKNETISGACLLVLPEDFTSACFDYVLCLSRNANYVTVIINMDYKLNIDEKLFINLLLRNITAQSGELYEMDIDRSKISIKF